LSACGQVFVEDFPAEDDECLRQPLRGKKPAARQGSAGRPGGSVRTRTAGDLRRIVGATADEGSDGTVYLDRTVATLTSNGGDIDPDLLRFLSPLGWEHINLTGDYTWPHANHIKPGKYRPLRRSAKP
jgi:hypothetical protein